ncbi:hypothetical protein EDD86DRAFT_278874 [Gorgonomyces haynaldii]|nr:hypothetical protein EDD86DRAFT_278874 [Gorgonomyces haynaldii]
MLTAQWYNPSEDWCAGLPDVMYGFFLRDENARNPVAGLGDVWPAGYTYQSVTSNRPYGGRCWTTLKAPLSKECCAYSLNTVSSKNWTASATMLADQANPLKQAPVAASDGTYCAVTSATYNNRTLFGMDKAYYRNHGICITPDSVTCFPNGTLAVYPQAFCSGTPTLYNLNTPVSMNDAKMRSVSAKMETVGQGTTEFSWTIILPSSIYSPTFRYFSDYMMVFFYVTAITAVVYTMYYYTRQFIVSKRFFMLAFVFCQLCWAIFAVTRVFTQVGYYNANSNGTLFFFGMTGSLLTVLLNMSFFFKMLNLQPLLHYVILAIIALFHYSMNWNNYIRFFSTNIFTPELVSVTQTTNATWNIFMFYADCIPPIYVVFRMFNVRWEELTPSKAWEIIRDVDRYFIVALILQILNSIAYVVQDRVRNFSELLGHDRIWLAFISVETAIQTYHSVLNVMLIERMKRTLESKSGRTKLATTKGVKSHVQSSVNDKGSKAAEVSSHNSQTPGSPLN